MEQTERIGEYELLKEIGCGSFGKLYKAEW